MVMFLAPVCALAAGYLFARGVRWWREARAIEREADLLEYRRR